MRTRELQQIIKSSGLDHARFIVEEQASQKGFDKCSHLFAELDRQDSEQLKQDLASLDR